MKLRAVLFMLALLSPQPGAAQGRPLSIVAAENFYGDLARQLAGPGVVIASILDNPDQDPHLFEASPSTARALAAANIVISNGADYDPWMAKLLRAAKSAGRQGIVVAELAGKRAGDNPHLWYDTTIMARAATAIAAALVTADPAHRDEHQHRLAAFTASLQPIDTKIAAMRARHAGVAVTATEPVFGYMAASLGLTMRNERFQLAVMNGTEPRASDVAAFEADLRQHRVRALIYNSQATDTAARRLLGIARAVGIAVVGVTETEPAGQTYQAWMAAQLDALDAALSKPPA